MRKIVKVTAISLGVGIALIAAFAFFLFHPGVLFVHELKHNNYTVYSQQELGARSVEMLDDIDRALRHSPIFNPSVHIDVIFGNGNLAFALIQRISWKLTSVVTGLRPALTYNRTVIPYFSHVITFRVPDYKRNLLVDPGSGGAIDLRRTLAHEIVHGLLQAHFGRNVVRYPMWKEEGYADYVAAFTDIFSNPHYEFWNSVKKIAEENLAWMQDDQGRYRHMRQGCQREGSILNEDGRPWATCYYISRVLMEYLLGVRRMSIDEVMSPRVTDVDTLNQLLTAYRHREQLGSE